MRETLEWSCGGCKAVYGQPHEGSAGEDWRIVRRKTLKGKTPRELRAVIGLNS
jgi:hypothetical protein